MGALYSRAIPAMPAKKYMVLWRRLHPLKLPEPIGDLLEHLLDLLNSRHLTAARGFAGVDDIVNEQNGYSQNNKPRRHGLTSVRN
jgi:hypothetical protein